MATLSDVVANRLNVGPRGASGASVDGFKVVDFTFSNSYTTGGEAIPGLAGFTTIDFVVISPKSPVANNTFFYDYTNNKILAAVGSTGAEVANTTNLSAVVLRILVFGS